MIIINFQKIESNIKNISVLKHACVPFDFRMPPTRTDHINESSIAVKGGVR